MPNKNRKKTVCCIGLGCMGLPTACLLATHGHNVIGVDTDERVVAAVNSGRPHFNEPGLPQLLLKAITGGCLVAKTAYEDADVFIIAVPTPLGKPSQHADLSYVTSACRAILPYLNKDKLVIVESTLPVGTFDRTIVPMLKKAHLAYCPERAIPGSTLHEMVHNDRLIGGIDRESTELARQVYATFVSGVLHLTDARTAEAAKLMENAFRDVNIALANEFALVAEEAGIDVWKAIELANKHPRVNILKPGPGVGGYCLTKDPHFLIQGLRQRAPLIRTARAVNDSMPERVIAIVKTLLGGTDSRVLTVLGAAYKADVCDSRQAPALSFIKRAEDAGFQVRVHDPLVTEFPHPLLGLAEAAAGSDCVVLLTDHSQFTLIDPSKVGRWMRTMNLVDCRNALNHQQWRNSGFQVRLLGATFA